MYKGLIISVLYLYNLVQLLTVRDSTISWTSLYLETLRCAMSHPASSVPSLGWAFVISTVGICSSLYVNAAALPLLDEAMSIVCQVCIELYKSVHKTLAIKINPEKNLKKSQKKNRGFQDKKIILEYSQSREFEYDIHDFV